MEAARHRALALLLATLAAWAACRAWVRPAPPPGPPRDGVCSAGIEEDLPAPRLVCGAPGEGRGLEGEAALAVGRPLDICSATEEELTLLPGIGPARARAIVRYRESGGELATVDDLVHVPGIGPVLAARLAPLARCGGAPAEPAPLP